MNKNTLEKITRRLAASMSRAEAAHNAAECAYQGCLSDTLDYLMESHNYDGGIWLRNHYNAVSSAMYSIINLTDAAVDATMEVQGYLDKLEELDYMRSKPLTVADILSMDGKPVSFNGECYVVMVDGSAPGGFLLRGAFDSLSGDDFSHSADDEPIRVYRWGYTPEGV